MKRKVKEGSVALVAFGGNAFTVENDNYTIENQRAAANVMCGNLLSVIEKGYDLVITHGNGPQVGNLMLQRDLIQGKVPPMPLDVLVAQTEGSLGYILQDELLNHLRAHSIGKYVVTMITQVRVDKNDSAFQSPTKPVGPFYSKEESEQLLKENPDWKMIEDAGRGYRRIVPSPQPKKIIQSNMIRSLVYSGNVVIAAGGGGIPIIKDENNRYVGVEAVIDKDLSSAMLANDVKADLLIILTGVDKVYLNFGTKEQESLNNLTYSQAKQYLNDGHFPSGSMGPKIESALKYLENGGRRAIITSAENLEEALDGKNGTHIVWM
jgi:carbamate kinase